MLVVEWRRSLLLAPLDALSLTPRWPLASTAGCVVVSVGPVDPAGHLDGSVAHALWVLAGFVDWAPLSVGASPTTPNPH